MNAFQEALALLSVFVVTDLIQAQNPEASVAARLKKLGWTVGMWEGSGWIAGADGIRTEFKTSFEIQPKLGGTVLLGENLMWFDEPGKGARTLVDGSIVVITWDTRTEKYRLRGHRIDGRLTDGAVTVEGRTIQVRHASEIRTEVRFTMTLDDTGRLVWRGEESKDGSKWTTFLECTMRQGRKA